MRIALAAAALLALALPARAQATDEALQGFVDGAIEGFLRPAAARFEDTAGTLSDRLDALCKAPDQAKLEAAREAFGATTEAWAEISFVTLDPMRQDDRAARVFFWPDPRGVTLRQTQGVLGEKDETATNADDIAGKSVAVQGLGALEFLLFGTGSETLAADEDPYRCRYARAAAENLHRIGGGLHAAYGAESTFAGQLSEPGPDNPLYRNPSESAEDLLASVGTGIELIRDRILTPTLGETADEAQPKAAPFWRSGETLPYLAHILTGMQKMLDAGGIESILSEERAWIAGSVDFEFENAERTIKGIGLPYPEAVETPETRQQIEALVYSLRNQRDLVADYLMASAGLKAGFNALDGD